MLDSVIKSKDVISMAEERCSEADVSLFVLVSTFLVAVILFVHLMAHGRLEGVGDQVVLRLFAFRQCDLRSISS